MPDEHAVLVEREGRFVLRFQRLLAHPPQRVWRALTEQEELWQWHPTPFQLEPQIGGEVAFQAPPGGAQMPPGRVLAYEPPRLLAYTWGEDELRFTLQAAGQDCLLTLEHTFQDRFKAARDGAGWHLCLDALAGSLGGAPVPHRREGERLPGGWRELNADYQQRFGISPSQATPVPASLERDDPR